MQVLLVEDAPAIRSRLKRLFADVPGVDTLIEAEGINQAMKIMSRLTPRVIVLDLHLRAESALGFLAYVKEKAPQIRVVVMTNDPSEPLRRLCKELGADHFFDKSTEFEAIVPVLEKAALSAQYQPGRS